MKLELQDSSLATENNLRQILVLKTNIRNSRDVQAVTPLLDSHPNVHRWNVDTEDVDHVLRIESPCLALDEIILTLRQAGYDCEELPD